MKWLATGVLAIGLCGCIHDSPTLLVTKSTPLSVASGSGDIVTLENLVDNGAMAGMQPADLDRALAEAVSSRQVDAARLLIKHGVRVAPEQSDGDLLALAAGTGDVEMTRLLLKNGESVQASGGAALITATRRDKLEVVRELVSQGVNVNATDRQSRSALYYASRGRDLALVRFLVEHGASPDAPALTGSPYRSDKDESKADRDVEQRFYGLEPPTEAEWKAIQDYLRKVPKRPNTPTPQHPNTLTP